VCGRFTLTSPAEIVAEFFDLADELILTPRFNIAPTQTVLIVRESSDSKDREAANLHWGLVPSWAKDRSIAAKLINARGETVAEKPSFRRAFRQQRCLVVADGFYEWKAAAEKGAAKQLRWALPVFGKNGVRPTANRCKPARSLPRMRTV
jgi:putative SOS response-associated peptidase YedK